MVPMSFGLRIPGDGTGRSSITSEDQIAQLNRNDWAPGEKTGEKPKEFLLSLTTGTVRALGEIDIQVRSLFLLLSQVVDLLSHRIPRSDLN